MIRKNRVAKAAVLLLALAVALAFAGCQPQVEEEDYDISGYIRGVLSESYNNGSSAAAATAQTENSNSATTAENASVRFFEKYRMNPNEAQQEAMTEVFLKAYANSKYTVQEKTKASYGYDVIVDYQVQTTFLNLESDINSRRAEAEKMGLALETGAEYIDGVIELCSNCADAPTYGDSASITFDILVDEQQNLSVNIRLFDQLDTAILPL